MGRIDPAASLPGGWFSLPLAMWAPLELLEHVEDDLRHAARTHERSIERPLPDPPTPIGT